MDVTPLIRDGQQIIQTYAAGVFRISGISYEGAVIVSPDSTVPWENVTDFSQLTYDSFAPLIERAEKIDVLLLGTGNKMAFLDPALKNKLGAAGLPIDIMDSGAACRTYNVLMAEGRRVVAAMVKFN
jgi:uncharacterized protein